MKTRQAKPDSVELNNKEKYSQTPIRKQVYPPAQQKMIKKKFFIGFSYKPRDKRDFQDGIDVRVSSYHEYVLLNM